MLYREIIAVCSQIHTKHINTVCGQNVELPIAKPGGTVQRPTHHLARGLKHAVRQFSTHGPLTGGTPITQCVLLSVEVRILI